MCEGTVSFETLLIGGSTSAEDYTSSLELISQNRTCTPQMDQTPVPKYMAGAAVLGSKIFYCGGKDDYSKFNSCHSFDLSKEGGGWQEEPSMVEARLAFGLSVVADSLIASGGLGSYGPLSSVEVFKAGDGWKHDLMLDMRETKFGHCSVVVGSWLYTIGGFVGVNASSLVEALDTTDASPSWIMTASMAEKRYGHACHGGVFDGQKGIYVADGSDEADEPLDSAEFYNTAKDIWQKIGPLITGRTFPSMTMLGSDLIVSGGLNNHETSGLTSVETWNGCTWVEWEGMRLGVVRGGQAAVSVKAGALSCI